jgi:hypothetical protein
MEPIKASGRTLGDTIVEILGNWKLIALAFATVLLSFLIVINDAEPGSTIEVLGVKYQRAKPKPHASTTSTVPIEHYRLPSSEIIRVDRKDALPILDGSLAIERRVQYLIAPNRSVLAEFQGGSIVGPNIGKIRVAARSLDGRIGPLFRPPRDDQQADFERNAYVEIEYRGRFFSLTAEQDTPATMRVTVKMLLEPTLELLPVARLTERVAVGND